MKKLIYIILKLKEKEFYNTIYVLAFERESSYFHSNETHIIHNFLKRKFWGENLRLRVKLLSKLLYFESFLYNEKKSELRKKAEEFVQIANHIQE